MGDPLELVPDILIGHELQHIEVDYIVSCYKFNVFPAISKSNLDISLHV